MRNFVKRKLKAGKPSVGTWVSIGHPDVTMYLADMGFDWIVCDMEHGPFGVETYHYMVQAMLYNRENCMPMARIPYHDLIWYKKALDAGAMGIVTPRVETGEMTEEMGLVAIVTHRNAIIQMVLDSVTSQHSKRAYRKALEDFMAWYRRGSLGSRRRPSSGSGCARPSSRRRASPGRS